MIAASLALSLLVAAEGSISYRGHSVLRCSPSTTSQMDALHDIDLANEKLDFWKEPTRKGGFVDIMVSDQDREELQHKMKLLNIPCEEMIGDVQEVIDAQKRLHNEKKGDASYFESYHPPSEVFAYIEDLASEFPNMASTSTIGTTTGGSDIKIIHISTNKTAGKKTLWFDGGLHAREWVTTPTVTYIADTLLRGYGTISDATNLLDMYDVIVCPIINVDGVDYTYAEDGDRMWRKTRSENDKSPCVGTDPCRNFDFEWAGAGASGAACSDTYYGPSAGSEPEVQAVQNYVCGHNDTIKLYINFHSYSQLWLSPWGYTNELPVDYTQQDDGSAVAVKAVKDTHGKVYEYGATSDTIYPASGIASDYAYGECGIKYSYTVELRDTGRYGFLLPPEEIIPSGEEMFAGVVALANYIHENP